MSLALEGIKVLDVSQVAAVPMVARHLADFGADVIHVEHPKSGDTYREVGNRLARASGKSTHINRLWETFNRNKRSMTLDVSRNGGQEVMYRLVKKIDVFLTNFRPFELEKFKLEYSTLSSLNEKLIYAQFTGYGDRGDEKDRPAYDSTAYWARSGAAHMVPRPGSIPAHPPGAFGDNVAALALAYGIMLALFTRERTGVGQKVHVSLFQTAVYQLCQEIATNGVLLPTRLDPENPLVNVFQTKDGRWLFFLLLQPDRYWPNICQAIGREELEHDPRFESTQARTANRHELTHILEEAFLSKTLAEWKPLLSGVPYDVAQYLPEVIADPQARANDFFIPYDHPTYGQIEVLASPINLSKTPATITMPAPEFGQHTEEVLLEYGYSWEDIMQLKEQGVIA